MRQLVVNENQAKNLLKVKEWMTAFNRSSYIKTEILKLLHAQERPTDVLEFKCSSSSMIDVCTAHGIRLYIKVEQQYKANIVCDLNSEAISYRLRPVKFDIYASTNPLMRKEPIAIVVAKGVEKISLVDYFQLNNFNIEQVVDLYSLELSLGTYVHQALTHYKKMFA